MFYPWSFWNKRLNQRDGWTQKPWSRFCLHSGSVAEPDRIGSNFGHFTADNSYKNQCCEAELEPAVPNLTFFSSFEANEVFFRFCSLTAGVERNSKVWRQSRRRTNRLRNTDTSLKKMSSVSPSPWKQFSPPWDVAWTPWCSSWTCPAARIGCSIPQPYTLSLTPPTAYRTGAGAGQSRYFLVGAGAGVKMWRQKHVFYYFIAYFYMKRSRSRWKKSTWSWCTGTFLAHITGSM